MKFIRFSLYLCAGLLTLTSCAQKQKQVPRDIASLEANGGMEGIWFLQGSSSTRGPYNGELEIRKGNDGTFDVVRVVTYINYFFDGLKVQEVWTGKAVPSNDILTIAYELRQGDFITRLNGQKKEPSSFKNPITVLSRFSPSPAGLVAKFTDKKVSDYSEWMTTKRSLEAQPLWTNQRRILEAKDVPIPPAVRKDALVKSRKKDPHFKIEKPVVVVDPTDYQFYKEAKDTIRVVNKITDDINITESVVKRNAYGPSLDQKAVGYDTNTTKFHLNEANLVVAALVDPEGKFTSYAQDPNAAFMTGMYLASQAMRFQVTRQPEALENVKRSLQGLFSLFEISENAPSIATSIAAAEEVTNEKPTVDLPSGWMRGSGKYQNFIWTEGADRETFVGMTQGLLWASAVLPASETQLWAELRKHARNLTTKEFAGIKPEEKSVAYGIAAFVTKDPEALKVYLSQSPRGTGFILNETTVGKNSSLSLLEKVNNIIVADLLGQTKTRDEWREKLMEDWIAYEPVQRHLAAIAAYGFSYRHGVRGKKFEIADAESRFKASLQQSIWGLREIPYPRPNLQVSIDHSAKSDGQKKRSTASVQDLQQGLQAYPAFELQAFSSDFLWTEPSFEYQASHKKDKENTGVDYLYAYWMARYSGVENVQ